MAKDAGNGPEDKNKKDEDQGAGNGTGDNSSGAGDNENTDELGFPKDTPLAEMTVEQREAYWKHKARKHENTVKAFPKDYDEQKKLADKWREHEDKQKPADQVEREQLEREIREQVRKDMLKETAPKLVEAEFKAQVGNRLKSDALALILEDIDHTKYLDADGKVDTERVKSRVEVIAPAASATPNNRQIRTHQGRRSSEGDSGMSAGRAAYEARHGKKKN
jgi:hypothetical protein